MSNLESLYNKKVLILGSSLQMLLLAYFLDNKGINVKLFDNSNNIGGAWKRFTFKKMKIRKQTNVIVPINNKEKVNQLKINNFLKRNFDIKINKIKDDIITPLKTKSKFSYNFDSFLKNVSKKKFLKKMTVKKIEIFKKKEIKINGKYLFDYVFIPTYFGINNIFVENKIIQIKNKIIKSEHVIALIKSNSFYNIHYSDFFNNFFDRVQFMKQGKFFTFSARITKNNKGSNNLKILKELEKIFDRKKILNFKKFEYKNHFRNESQILKLNQINQFKCIKHVNTQSLLSFLVLAIKYLK